jgi:hypothetical protein
MNSLGTAIWMLETELPLIAVSPGGADFGTRLDPGTEIRRRAAIQHHEAGIIDPTVGVAEAIEDGLL